MSYLFLKNDKEFEQLKEVLKVISDCLYFGISDEEEAKALESCENPLIIDELIKRMGSEIRIPISIIKQFFEEFENHPEVAVKLSDIQTGFWTRKMILQKRMRKPLESPEFEVIADIFFYYAQLVEINDKNCVYKLVSDWEGCVCT